VVLERGTDDALDGAHARQRSAEARSIGVSTGPRQAALARIRSLAKSSAIDRVSSLSPPQKAARAATFVWQAGLCTEETWTIDPPPRRRISGMA